ncbi:MAG: hypothetical protein L3J78_01350 [Thermoplasmata archaeon]|nr:hypothetical protein [Thermoplasmata archaeon]
MFGTTEEGARHRGALVAVVAVVLLAVSVFGILGVSPSPAHASTRLVADGAFTASISFSPNPVSAGTQTQIHLDFTNGGSSPFTVWVNGSAPGCNPPSNPFTTSNHTNNFPCTPTSSGSYNVHIDAIDSAAYKTSTSGTLTVNTGSGGCTSNCGGNRSGSGNGTGSGSFSLPPELITMMFTLAIVFFAGLFALAGGVIAMAVLISRRLRQLTEAMAPSEKAPKESEKPPT